MNFNIFEIFFIILISQEIIEIISLKLNLKQKENLRFFTKITSIKKRVIKGLANILYTNKLFFVALWELKEPVYLNKELILLRI